MNAEFNDSKDGAKVHVKEYDDEQDFIQVQVDAEDGAEMGGELHQYRVQNIHIRVLFQHKSTLQTAR